MPLHVPPVFSAVTTRTLARSSLAIFGKRGRTAVEQATHQLAQLFPRREIFLTDSGTTALMLALRMTLPQGTRQPVVALPAYACPDIGTAAIGAGYEIVLYDLNPETLEPDLATLERTLHAGATHVVVTHLFGRIVDVGKIKDIAVAYGVTVIEDAAQHAGGTLRGVRGGALAEWSILSFGRGKGINAGGGGAVMREGALDLDLLPRRSPGSWKSVAVIANASVAQALSMPRLFWLPSLIPALQLGQTVYHPPKAAQAISVASALLLTDALRDEGSALEARRNLESRYWNELGEYAHLLLQRPDIEMQSGALRFPIRMGHNAGQRLSWLGVARSYPRTLLEYPEVAKRCHKCGESFPGARALADTLYTLPTHSLVTGPIRQELLQNLSVILRDYQIRRSHT